LIAAKRLAAASDEGLWSRLTSAFLTRLSKKCLATELIYS
jgi:hypothetical protein